MAESRPGPIYRFFRGLWRTLDFSRRLVMNIIFLLIVEPHGLAQLWRLTKEKLRLWPFPH